ncbi:MAG: hypothetical protein R6X34_10445 [Chloroflexota bacterium]
MTEIAEAVGASLQNTSQHLHLMRAMGILYPDAKRKRSIIAWPIRADSQLSFAGSDVYQTSTLRRRIMVDEAGQQDYKIR